MKVIHKFDNYFEANIVKEMLTAEGVNALLKDENTMTQWGGLASALGGISLLVPESDASLAIALIENASQEASQRNNEALKGQQIFNEDELALDPNNRVCPFCGSKNTKSLYYVPKPPRFLKWIVAKLTEGLNDHKWHCFNCGKDFE